MAITGKSEIRVDAFDKATGRTKYYDDLAPSDALIVRVKHSTIAHALSSPWTRRRQSRSPAW